MSKEINILVLSCTFIVGGLLSTQSVAAEHSVSQKGKKFLPEKLQIKADDTVKFMNDDNTVHNIYSVSPSNHFELGIYKKGQEREVVLAKPGIVEVECLIHPDMKMTVEVTK